MNSLKKGQRGFTIIEVLIATLILMIFVPALFLGLQMGAHAAIKADGQATAEAAAKSEIEFIKSQVYEDNTSWVYSLPSGTRPWTGGPTLPEGYTLTVSAGMVPGGLSVAITDGGSGYSTAPSASFTGGGGTGASGIATISNGLGVITATSGGSGYTSSPLVVLTGGGGTGASASAVVVAGQVTSIIVNNRGTGYASPPSVSFSGGGGTGAAASAELTGYVSGITIIDQGTGYTSSPVVTISGGGGTGATATARIAEISEIQQIIITISRGTADKPWYYVNYALKDYWRTA